ncbi:LOW QUALITY PROTEIN: vacuolar fusion protein MON1 homolog B-like [Melanerpes formicivorus]|uniref:LOW QUALITY PROTEIN: vacuolar fusion protein MON1 homolog B-like n=1 Tax=Melanerpes formicivorus TaxID=211600 RepID=UPI00358F137A
MWVWPPQPQAAEATPSAAILCGSHEEEEEEEEEEDEEPPSAVMTSPEQAVTSSPVVAEAILDDKEEVSAAILDEELVKKEALVVILDEEKTLGAILDEEVVKKEVPAAILDEEKTPEAILDEELVKEVAPAAILDEEVVKKEALAAILDTEKVAQEAPPAILDTEEEVAVAAAPAWRGRRKHVFVLSEAGKPIYSRHGNEEALAATMGVMMALVSFIQAGDNVIRAICCEDRTLVFEQRGPLLLVSVSRTRQSAAQLRRELAFVHDQILSLLTRGGISRVFARRRGYDLRRLLAGAEAVLDRLLSGAATDGRLLLGASRCLPLPSPLRRSLSGALRRAAASSPAPAPALALLATAGGQLVTAAHQRALAEGGRLCATDLHLLLNLLGGGGGAGGAGEVWTPVCLPGFNPDSYFYAYAARLGEEEEEGEGEEEGSRSNSGGGGLTLILLSTEREGFYAAAACRRRLEEALRAQGCLGEVAAAVRGGGAGYGPARPGAPELRHFLYKPLEGPEEMQQLPQFTSPELEEPYRSEEEQLRLFDLYHYLHSRVHSPQRPLRLLYHVAQKETLLAWVTGKFELYGCFSPLVSKAAAIGVLTKLLRWLKKEEDWLFARCPPPYCAAPTRHDSHHPTAAQ